MNEKSPEKLPNILVLSLDRSVADSASAAGKRALDYAKMAGTYTVLTPQPAATAGEKSSALREFFRQAEKSISSAASGAASGETSAGKYDLISVQDPYFVGLAAVRLARKYGVALEVQVHGFEKLSWLRHRIARRVLSHADGVRTVSERLKKILMRDFGVEESRITVVPIFVPPLLDVAEKLPAKKTGDFIFLTVSRLVPVKNIAMQLEAFAKIVASNTSESVDPRKNAVLWIAGDGPERQKLDELSRRLGIADRVKFFGAIEREKLAEFYKAADVFLLTSESEGWGMAVIEAAQQGLPIIMTDVGCAGEVIKDGESGLVIPVGNRENSSAALAALEQAMGRVISDGVLRASLGAGAKAAAKNLSSKEQTLALYKAAWNKAILCHKQ